MTRIFWDTNLFIYLVEGRGQHVTQVANLLDRMFERGDELLTSAMTLGELLVGPMAAGNVPLARYYERMLQTYATVLPFDLRAAPRFAEIRRDRSIQAPDAIQLACAALAGADVFVTNDGRLARKNIRGIRSIQSLRSLGV